MQIIDQISKNEILLTAALAWAVSCFFKAIVCLVTCRNVKLGKVFGSGGMPSTHSATVTGLAVTTGLTQGFDTPLFAIALILAIVVMYDASGIRRAAGQHASFINILLDDAREDEDEDDGEQIRLKEVLGHTPLEVTAGAILGAAVSVICHIWL